MPKGQYDRSKLKVKANAHLFTQEDNLKKQIEHYKLELSK